MRLPSLKTQKSYFERTIKLNGGVNTSSSPMVLSENEISECSNVIFEASLLKTRNGFFTDDGMLLNNLSKYEYVKEPFSILKETFNIDGTEYKLGYSIDSDEVSYAKLNTYLICADGSYKPQEPIIFGRADDTTFLIPDKISVFKGAKKYGAGIYIFCSTKNLGTTVGEKDYRTFELDSLLTNWKRLFESDYYIPTVYYNGRGNCFSESAVADDPLYEKPAELESQNLLTGRFYAYFSVDGSSDSFQLPLTELDDESVVCDLSYKNGMSFSWTISGDSAEIDFLTTKVTAKCNRKTGVVSFIQDGKSYPLPMYVRGSINNLRILAKKQIEGEKASVLGTAGAVNYKSNIIVYGSDQSPNKIYTASTANPLYFPKDSVLDVGIDGERITAIKTLGSTLVAFSPNSAYSLKLTEGDIIASTELISGVDKSFYKPDILGFSLLNREFGCPYPESLSVIGDSFVFKSKYKVYTMNSSGRVYSVSYPISAADVESENNYGAIGFNYNDYYGILMGGKIYLADITGAKVKNGRKEASWYCWELPEYSELVAIADFEGKTIFGFMGKSRNCYYLSKLYGDKDIAMDIVNDVTEIYETNITAYFKTAFLELDSIKIEAVILEAGTSKPIKVTVDSHYSGFDTEIDLKLTDKQLESGIYKKVTLYPSLKADTASIKIIGEAPFYLNRLKFLYR